MTVSNEMDFEFMLKKSFDEEAFELPESLKKENVIMMLENEKSKPKKKKKHIFPKILASAAALIIIVASAVVVPVIIPDKPLVDVTTTTEELKQETEALTTSPTAPTKKYDVIDNGLKATDLKQAESNEELQKHFVKLYRENKIDDFFDGIYGAAEDSIEFMTDGAVFNNAAASAPESAAPGATQGQVLTTAAAAQNSDNKSGTGSDDRVVNYGQTNTQVENVDEADIIKNDGKYLYILSGGVYNYGKRAVTVVDAGNMKVASKIEVDEEDYYYNIQEMYVHGDRLVLVANEYEKQEPKDEDSKVAYDVAYPYYGSQGQVVSFLYDITDRKNPIFVRKVSQDGTTSCIAH